MTKHISVLTVRPPLPMCRVWLATWTIITPSLRPPPPPHHHLLLLLLLLRLLLLLLHPSRWVGRHRHVKPIWMKAEDQLNTRHRHVIRKYYPPQSPHPCPGTNSSVPTVRTRCLGHLGLFTCTCLNSILSKQIINVSFVKRVLTNIVNIVFIFGLIPKRSLFNVPTVTVRALKKATCVTISAESISISLHRPLPAEPKLCHTMWVAMGLHIAWKTLRRRTRIMTVTTHSTRPERTIWIRRHLF